ncbi:MAG: hypothetical protein FJ042_04520 [Candidatus Cloacimonetes bacterium]|nr:hypothetical protein [Candidatus Cloacimonadota bacterium]
MEKYPNINILLNVAQCYIPKAEFVLRTYCYILRLNPRFTYGGHFEGTHLYYGRKTDKTYPIKIHYEDSTAEFFEQRELYPLDKVNFCLIDQEYIPFLFSQQGSLFALGDDHCLFRKDVIASGFYFLTCWHEFIISERGLPQGRVDFRQSLQYRWDFTEIPVVDVYCHLIRGMMEQFLPELSREIHWNEASGFAVSLSHDIDYWDYWTPGHRKEMMSYNLKTLRKRPLRALYKVLAHTIHKSIFYNPWKHNRQIVRKELDRNINSTWFLLASEQFEDERQNYLTDVVYREQIIDAIGQQEIGLHGSPQSAFDLDTLNQELETLVQAGFNPTGFRTHYLHFDYQKSFSILEQAGIQYDSTLGYWENIGFRAGVSFPFFPFNLAENRPFHVLEIPLIVMDTTLHSPKAMGLNLRRARRRLIKMIDLADKYQSHITILWHNNIFDPVDFPGWGSLYWKTVDHALAKGGWVTDLRSIYEEWVMLSY